MTNNASDIEYNKKIDEATKGTPAEQQPKKEPLRKRIQQRAQMYVKDKQQKEYDTKIAKAYYLNFFVQSPNGSWSLYKTCNKTNKEECNNIRRELQRQKTIFTEAEGDVNTGRSQLNSYTGRLAKTWKQNLVKTGKEINKEIPSFVEEVEDVFATNRAGTPQMPISAWGSMRQPSDIPKKEQLPSFQSYQAPIRPRAPARPKKPLKQYISPEEFEGLKQQGFTERDLAESGIESKRSKHFQEQSPFGRMVSSYRPLSSYQIFGGTVPNYRKTEYQQRIAEGRVYEAYYPPFAGEADESGRSTLIFTPKFVGNPSQPRPLFQPRFIVKPPFNPMMQEIVEYDAQGNPITKKRFFTPPMVRV